MDHRDGDFWLMFYRRRSFEDSLFQQGSGEVEVLPGKIRVSLDDPGEGAVLRFAWLEELAAEPRVVLSPLDAGEGIELIGVAPGEVEVFELSRPGWW